MTNFILIIVIFLLASIICDAEKGLINDSVSLIDNERQSEIIFSVSDEKPLKLNDGYELVVKSVDIDGNKAYMELYKDGKVIDSKVIIPANEANGSFIYSRPGTSQTIKVHFKNVFRGADRNLATVDRVWQTSESGSSAILLNSTQSRVIESEMPLMLEEGYELIFNSVDIDGNKAYLELSKDGQIVDSQVIVGANEADDTLIYSKPGTEQKILVHFKNAFRGADGNLITIDRLLQTSEINPSLILIDYNSSWICTTGTALRLEDGYELTIESVDIDGNKVYVELSKDGSVVDSKIIIAANDVEDTYVYSEPGTSHDIKVHFKNAFRGPDGDLTTIDSIIQ